MGRVCLKRERMKEKLYWEREAYLTACIMNCWLKRPIKYKRLIPRFLADGSQAPKKTKEELDREFREAIRLTKSKFWTSIKGNSLDNIRIFGDNPEDDAKLLEKMKKEGKFVSVLDFLKEQK